MYTVPDIEISTNILEINKLNRAHFKEEEKGAALS